MSTPATIQTINRGTSRGTGDPYTIAIEKINENFAAIAAKLLVSVALQDGNIVVTFADGSVQTIPIIAALMAALAVMNTQQGNTNLANALITAEGFVGGSGGHILFQTAAATIDGQQTITMPSGATVVSISINGVTQLQSAYTVSGLVVTIPPSTNVVTGDIVSVAYFL